MRQGRLAGPSRILSPGTATIQNPMVMISERPASVEDRALPTHWEGDLIIGAKDNPRSARSWNARPGTLLLYLPNGHTATEVQDAIIDKLADIPHSLAPVTDLGPGEASTPNTPKIASAGP